VQTIGGLPEESGVKVKARWRRSGSWVKDGCWENFVIFSMFFFIRILGAQNTFLFSTPQKMSFRLEQYCFRGVFSNIDHILLHFV
jgi:hypothetical protein